MAFNPIDGTDDPERLDGTIKRDLIMAGAGNDSVHGWYAADRLYGEDGDDLVTGSAGNDSLYGGDGNDELHSDIYDQGYTDHMYGGAGNDRIFSANKTDYSYAGSGDDTMTIYFDVGGAAYGGAGTDTLVMHYIGSSLNSAGVRYSASVILNGPGAGAAAGPDSMVLDGFERLQITTYMGDDTVQGGDLGDTIDVYTGADVVRAMGGDDVVKYRTRDAVNLDGGDGVDRLFVQGIEASPALNVVVTGTSGTDGLGSVLTGFERWNILGSALDDRAELGALHDVFKGWWGNDTAFGMEGGDRLVGGYGDDLLSGGAGQDTLAGEQGADRLEGGSGADDFVFQKALAFGDVIADFVGGEDRVVLGTLALGGLLPLGAVAGDRFQLEAAVGTGAQFVWVTGDASGNGMLYFDADGTGDGAALLVAVMIGLPALTADDLTVIA